VAFQVVWTLISSGDRNCGEVWPDRMTAEHVAAVLKRSGYVKDVRIRFVRAEREEG
jgi:hypothetical protein